MMTLLIGDLPSGTTRRRLRDRLLEAPRGIRNRLRRRFGFADVCGHYVRLDLLHAAEPIVVDAGANKGSFLSHLGLTAKGTLLAIEPNTLFEPTLRQLPRVRTMMCGLGSSRGTKTFFVSDNPEGSSMLEAYASQSGISGEVQIVVKDLDQIFEELGTDRIDLLKLDVEGAEISILLETKAETLLRIGQISVEFHVFLGGNPELQQVRKVVARLRGLGFTALNAPRSGGDFSNVLFLNDRLVGLGTRARVFLAVVDPGMCEICDFLDRLRLRLHRIRGRSVHGGES